MKRLHTILLVENVAPLRRFVATVLKDNGYRVLEVANARDALEVAGRHAGPIHLLLTDFMLPGPRDGLDVARGMKRIRAATRALVMSGYARSYSDHLELEAVADGFLAKPFTDKGLLAAVAACLEDGSAAPVAAPVRTRSLLGD